MQSTVTSCLVTVIMIIQYIITSIIHSIQNMANLQWNRKYALANIVPYINISYTSYFESQNQKCAFFQNIRWIFGWLHTIYLKIFIIQICV